VSGLAVSGDPTSRDDRPGSSGPSSLSPPDEAAATSTSSSPPTTTTRPPRQRRRERPCGLPAWRRLRATRDFTRVERQGARASGACVAVTVRAGPGRLGFVVSKKVDTRASERNRLKRRLREILRHEKDRFLRRPGGSVDVIVTARDSAKALDFEALRADVLAAFDAAVARLASAPPPRRPRR
jgi:ribonuclease P protein component